MPVIAPATDTAYTWGMLRAMTPSDSTAFAAFPPKEGGGEGATKGLTAYWRDIRRETSLREVAISLAVVSVPGEAPGGNAPICDGK